MYKVIPTVEEVLAEFPSLQASYGSDAKLHIVINGKEISSIDLADRFLGKNSSMMTERLYSSVRGQAHYKTYVDDFKVVLRCIAKIQHTNTNHKLEF